MRTFAALKPFFCLIITLPFFSGVSLHAQNRVLLENVTIIDGTGREPQANKSILIAGDSIQQILDHTTADNLSDVRRINLTGKYLLPGLFDMHVHLATDPTANDRLDLTKKRLSKYLEHRVTGVRDMAGDTRQLAYLARQAALDEIKSPDIYYSALMAGPSFFDDPRTVASARGHKPGTTAWMMAITEETDMAVAVAQAKGTGAQGIKIYADLPADLCAKIIVAAKAQNLKVWAHASVFPALPQDLAEAGIHSVSHAPLLAWQVADNTVTSKLRYERTVLDTARPAFRALIQTMAQKQVYLDPTIKIFAKRQTLFANALKATYAAYQAGVPLVVGTDMSPDRDGLEYMPITEEMIVLVNEVGIPPLEVIKAATLNSARLLGIADQVGSITPGKKANLLILDANPLEDIRHLDKVRGVIKNGKQVN